MPAKAKELEKVAKKLGFEKVARPRVDERRKGMLAKTKRQPCTLETP
jgi:hypothetical protein